MVRILCILCPIPTLAAISSTVMQGFDRCQERCAKRGCHADRYLRNAVIAHATRQSGSGREGEDRCARLAQCNMNVNAKEFTRWSIQQK